jgi:hypothetical protein
MAESQNPRSHTGTETNLSALAVTTMAALYEAEFFEEMEQVRSRVLSRGAALFEQLLGSDQHYHLVFKPMAELLLLHVRETAVAPRPADERRHEIRWALDASGF